jgi:hypothetical protein
MVVLEVPGAEAESAGGDDAGRQAVRGLEIEFTRFSRLAADANAVGAVIAEEEQLRFAEQAPAAEQAAVVAAAAVAAAVADAASASVAARSGRGATAIAAGQVVVVGGADGSALVGKCSAAEAEGDGQGGEQGMGHSSHLETSVLGCGIPSVE